MKVRTFTAVIHKEGDLYVAECPEVGTGQSRLYYRGSYS